MVGLGVGACTSPYPSLYLTLTMMTYHPQKHNMSPNSLKKMEKCVILVLVIVYFYPTRVITWFIVLPTYWFYLSYPYYQPLLWPNVWNFSISFLPITPRIHRVDRFNSMHVDHLNVHDIWSVNDAIIFSPVSPVPLPFPTSNSICIRNPFLSFFPFFSFPTGTGPHGLDDCIMEGSHRDYQVIAGRPWYRRQPCRCKSLSTNLVPSSRRGYVWGTFAWPYLSP